MREHHADCGAQLRSVPLAHSEQLRGATINTGEEKGLCQTGSKLICFPNKSLLLLANRIYHIGANSPG